MKTLFTFLFIFFAMALATAQIPGGNFENWEALIFEYPEYSNANIYTADEASKTTHGLLEKTDDANDGTYALKFSTLGSEYFGFVIYGQMGDEGPDGGIPFDDDPTQVTVSYKCNLAVGDSALIWVWLYSGGNQITTDAFKVGGIQDIYKDTTFNLSSYTAAPDSLMFALVPCDPMIEEVRTAGNEVYFDNIRFNGTKNLQIPDNSFESWGSITKEFTDEMYYIRAEIEKSSDAYNGDFALKMSTKEASWDEDNQQVNFDGQLALWGDQEWNYNETTEEYENTITGGLPVVERIDTLVFYHKYLPNTGVIDTASAALKFSKDGAEVFNSYFDILPTETYQKFEIPFDLDDNWTGSSVDADLMILEFQASKWRNIWSSTDVDIVGSSLYIDYMYFKSQLFTQTASSGLNGNVTPLTADVIKGNSITFTITPDDGYEIISALYNDADIASELVQDGSSYTYTVNVESEGVFYADFGLISGTEDIDSLEENMTYYPNPTSGILNLQGIKENSLVEIVSITGITVYQNRISNNTTIDISDLVEGIYFVKVENMLIGKVIKH